MKHAKGFTLIELLIVIAIIAVLSVVVVLTLNPAELLRQARDSTRISDMSSLNTALTLLLADGGTFPDTNCHVHASSSVASCVAAGFASSTLSTTTARTTDGTGWINVNFAAISSGSPFGVLPIDPTNNSSYFYAYRAGSSSTYKLNARMESSKYHFGGSADVVTNDGGQSTSTYEVGNSLSL